jgi:hypothetical protein
MKYYEIKVDFLKLWIALLFTALAGTSAWLYNNYEKMAFSKSAIVLFFDMTLFIALFIITKKCYKLIREVKNYKGEGND